jgi:hypothetical protein
MGIMICESLGIALNKGLKTACFAVEQSAADNGYNLTPIPLTVDRPWTEMHESNQLPNNNRKRF